MPSPAAGNNSNNGTHLRAHRLLRRQAYIALAAHLRACGRAELLAREKRHAGGSALHVAAALAPTAVLRAILSAAGTGASALETRDGESGWTALHCAMHAGRVSSALALLVAGAVRAPTDADMRIPADLYALRWAPHGGVVQKPESADSPAAPCEAWAWGSNTIHQIGGPSRSRAGAARAVARAVSAATGQRHSLYVLADGSVSAVGGGARGVLGLGDERPRAGLEVVTALRDVHVVAIACSAQRSAAVSASGDLYVWGAPQGSEPVLLPHKVARGGIRSVRIVQVALSDHFWIALDDSGGVWGQGTNLEGELAMDETRGEVDIPKKITALSDKKVEFVFVASGAPENAVCGAVMKADKSLFVWGRKFGRRPRRVRFEKLDPMFGGKEPQEVVTGAAAGDGFVVIITKHGRIYGLRAGNAPPVAFRIWKLTKRYPSFVSACANRFVIGDEFGECWDMKWELDAERPKGLLKVDGLRGISSLSIGKMHAVCIVRARIAVKEPRVRTKRDPASMSEASSEATDGPSWSSSSIPSSLTSPARDSNCNLSICSAEDEEYAPPSLSKLCEDVILKSLSLSNVSDMLLFAAEMHIPRLRDICLAFVRNNFDILITLHGVLDHLIKAVAACEPDALDGLLRGTETIEKEHDAANEAGFSVWEQDGEENTTGVPLSALQHGKCEKCTDADTENKDVDEGVLDKTGLSPFSLTASAASRKLRSLRKKLQSIQRIAAKVDAGENIDEAARAKLLKKCCVERDLGQLEKYIAVELFARSPTSSPPAATSRTTDDAPTRASPFNLVEDDVANNNGASPASFPPTRRNLNAAFMATAASSQQPAPQMQVAHNPVPQNSPTPSAAPQPVSSHVLVFQRPPPALASTNPTPNRLISPSTPTAPSSSRKARGRARTVLTLGAMPSAASIPGTTLSPVTPSPHAPAGGTACPWGSPASSGSFSSRGPRALSLRSPPARAQPHAFSAILAEQAREAERERAGANVSPVPAHMRAGRRAIPVAVPVPGARATAQSWNWPWQGGASSPGSGSPSLRDIQREEEHNARTRRAFGQGMPAFAAVPVGASPPRTWNRLPGDHMPQYKSLPEIEAEERALRARRGNR